VQVELHEGGLGVEGGRSWLLAWERWMRTEAEAARPVRRARNVGGDGHRAARTGSTGEPAREYCTGRGRAIGGGGEAGGRGDGDCGWTCAEMTRD